MKKIFPNIETAIIWVFLLIVLLWGVSKCNKKKVDASVTGTEQATDTLASPAARTLPPPTATLPQQPTTANPGLAMPPQYAQTVTGSAPSSPAQTPQQAIPQQPISGQTTPPKTPGAQPTVAPAPVQQTVASGTALYVLINGLNVRTKPDLKAKSLGKLKIHDQVSFLNEVTETAQTVRLADGTEITKPWFKIKTKKGTIGWVHGSGVDFYKRKPNSGL